MIREFEQGCQRSFQQERETDSSSESQSEYSYMCQDESHPANEQIFKEPSVKDYMNSYSLDQTLERGNRDVFLVEYYFPEYHPNDEDSIFIQLEGQARIQFKDKSEDFMSQPGNREILMIAEVQPRLKNYSCNNDICEYHTDFQACIINHVKRHMGLKKNERGVNYSAYYTTNYPCKQGRKKKNPEEQLYNVKKTKKVIDKTKHQCIICGRSFAQYEGKYTHIKNIHNKTTKEEIKACFADTRGRGRPPTRDTFNKVAAVKRKVGRPPKNQPKEDDLLL